MKYNISTQDFAAIHTFIEVHRAEIATLKIKENSIISADKFNEEFPKVLELLKQGNTGPFVFNFQNLVATIASKIQKAEKDAKERAEKEAKELAEKAKIEAEKVAKEAAENAKKEAEKAAKEATENAKDKQEGWFSKTFGSLFGGDKKKEEPTQPQTEEAKDTKAAENHDQLVAESHVVAPKVEAKVETIVEHKVEPIVEQKKAEATQAH